MELSPLGLLFVLSLHSYSGHAEETPKAVLVLDPDQTQFYSGDTVTLRCSIEGQNTSGWWYIWQRGGQQVHPHEAWTKSDAYEIHPLHETHSGIYTCTGLDNSKLTTSDPKTLSVSTLPTATLTVEPQGPVFTGETVTLKCVIEPERVWKYKWYTDRNSNLLSQSDTSTHTITVSESDEGYYWCQGEMRDRPVSSQMSGGEYLAVKAEPTATLSVVPPQGPYYPGDEVTLRCDIAEYTDWHQYRWYRGRDPIPSQESQTISLPDHVGQYQYTCIGRRGSRPRTSQRSGPVSISVTALPLATLTVEPHSPVFTGETVTLKCVIESLSGWTYRMYKWPSSAPVSEGNTFTIRGATESHKGQYWCQGERRDRPTASQLSSGITLDVTEKAQAIMDSLLQMWLTEGDSVTLNCEVRGSTTGWRFHWYKTAPYSPELVYMLHENRRFYLQLVSDSVSGAGGSYTLSPAALRHTGVYVCRAERGEPAYHTQFSQPQPLWVTGVSPPASVIIHSNWTQIFTYESLSLSCGVQGNSTGWRLRWFTDRGGESKCPTDWRSETGSTCSIRPASSSDSGVYWCQSESGEQSDPVNITVHTGDVILESPAHPVTEGDPLTLRCRYRYKPSNMSADFYKDGTLLQTSTTGDMIIPAVSESHEGVYRCKNPEKGESPESWVTVKETHSIHVDSGSFILLVVGVVMGISLVLVGAFSVFRLHQSKYLSGLYLTTTPTDQQQQQQQQQMSTNQSSDRDQSQSAGREGSESEYMPLQNRSTDVYDTITPLYMPLQRGVTDVYETIQSSKDSQEDDEEGYDDVVPSDTRAEEHV